MTKMSEQESGLSPRTRVSTWLDSLHKDARFAVRALRRSPGFALAVIGMLALGIGSATAIFSAIDQTVLREPFPHYERTAIFGGNDAPFGFISVSYPIQVMPCIERGKSFEAFALNAWGRGSMTTGSETFGVEYGNVNRDFFTFFNGSAMLGRLFRPDEFAAASADVMVLSHQFWKDYFGGDPGVIGRRVFLKDRSCQIIGVLSGTFSPVGMSRITGVFMPLVATSDPSFTERRPLTAGVRLRPGITIAQANAEVSVLGAALNASPRFRERHKKSPIYLKSLAEAEPGRGFASIHGAFLGAVGFLFAIACIGAIDLMLVRLSQRRRELGIRAALGGSRARMTGLVIMESLILNLIAGLFGICLAIGTKPLVLSMLTGSGKVFEQGFSLDGRALLAASGASLLSALIVALFPALRLRTDDPQTILRESGIAFSESRKLRRLRGSLVVASAAMAMVLLTGTGLMTRTVWNLMHEDRGFDPDRKIALWIDLPKPLQPAQPRYALSERLQERLRRLPGIANVATSSTVPLAGTSIDMIIIDGKTMEAGPNPVSPTYFRGMGIRLLKGRWLPVRPEGSSGVVLINASMSKEWFGTDNPIGRIINLGSKRQWEVIGVVSDIRDDLRSNERRPQFYYPNWQDTNRSDVISLRLDLSTAPTPVLTRTIRKAIYDVNPQIGVRAPVELEKAAREQINRERFTLFVLELISAVAMLLAVLGLFSVMAYNVSQRMKDFGIRLALGAQARRVFFSVLSRGSALGAIGIVIGLFGSWALTRSIKSLLYETNAVDPIVYSLATLLMLLAVCLACWIPARRAARADPWRLLRME